MTAATTPLQPLLHALLVTLRAPSQVWCSPDGQVHAHGLHGVYHADVRVLSQAEVRVDGELPEAIAAGGTGPGTFEASVVLRGIDGPGADPTTLLRRRRTVTPGEVTEELEVSSGTDVPVSGRVSVHLASDLARTETVKQGLPTAPVAPEVTSDGVRWSDDGTVVDVTAPGAEIHADHAGATLMWDVRVTPGQPVTVGWSVRSEVTAVVHAPATPAPEWSVPQVEADDRRLPALVTRSLADLDGLRMSAGFAPDETFLAAGAPWFFTLFGRDSIWAARLLLPLGTDLARGTLRTLAARQGTRTDPATSEQPGKILHEVRSQELKGEGGMSLPPLYYGTVDATSLWVCLLHDAWRWGMARDDVEGLLPALDAALGWMRDHGDADGDGFLDYADTTGHGLSNQGWKDSGDSIQWKDGRLAEGPIALSEVQAYAHEAAVGAADLLDALGRPGSHEWRDWAAALKARFREKFWLHDGDGPYVAIALDRHGAPVDSVASNMGHLLGTGLLDPDEERAVAHRLVSDDMSSGYGLRTLSTTSRGYWPLGYHRGTVWTHDTAIAVVGLAKAGLGAEAGVLARGLLEAAPHFAFQLPELYGGNEVGDGPGPLPYPAACHPQAWSAASAVAILTAALGLDPAPDGGLRATPPTPSAVGALDVDGLRVGGRSFRVRASADGAARVEPAQVEAAG
ncbi:Amylo-alpha-16-glucosidase [Xylanimonas cellulosilytica DSM 15894]|uniref:Amylo-alpha-16-glucosidase n=1 Tax=Xylanimonas cellulosilytica (strain DSM 15894 / JCM 12276 / CECT 5975 / KCTC 9989 / LMG 20990 / NBRC 107835 / XIL07) TaxID=446471 RepID=D1BZL4_XYLCX|nr:glycogen debranching N-terminal domain-containing protein [Xylanimonas cellulosilytica]ACZ30168.1 Amylo-alpha-16-glucosidase [Xylanimonas cellulosilytica DSM 15894]